MEQAPPIDARGSRVFLILLALVIALGAVLRLADLGGPSLWLDEILHLQVTQSLADEPWVRHLAGVREIKGGTENGALYYRLQIWGQRLAPGETGARLFPALLGTLTLPLMALAGRLLGGRLVALAATLLLAVSPLHVYYSREGRPYSLLMALALLLLYGLLLKGSRAGIGIAYAGCLAAAYAGLHAVPVLLSFAALSAIALGWNLRDGAPLRRSPYLHYLAAAVLALGLAYGLYMTRSEINAPTLEPPQRQIELQQSPVFQSPLSRRSLEMLVASMTTSGHPAVLTAPRSWALIALAALGLAATARRRPRAMAATAGMFVLPAALSIAALVSVGRWYGMNYTSPALPAFLLLAALGSAAGGELAVKALAARGKTQTAPRADLFRQPCVAKSAKYDRMPVVWRLDLTKNLSLSAAADFCHGLLGRRLPAAGRAAVRWGSAGAVLLVLAAPNLAAARADPYRKLDWRGVARFFDAVALEDEPVVVPNLWPQICLDYYLRQLGRRVEFVNAWESAPRGAAVVAARPRGWLLTAGFRRSNEVRAWMHGFVPVLKRPEEELALFFFPDFVTLLETRFAAGRGAVFERQLAARGGRFDFDGDELALQGQGWSFPEETPDGTRFQWAVGERAELGLPIGRPRTVGLRLRVRPFVYPGAPTQRLELWLNDARLASLDLPAEWSEHRLAVPAAAWSSGANVLTLRFAESARPADVVAGSRDSRQLSAAFDYLEVVD